MPALTITVVSQNDEPLADELKAEFGARGGTIGRGTGSTLLLPDPLRQISRTHARIEMQDGSFVLCDQGSVTPVLVNGKSLGNGNSSRIGPGDEIVIGSYRMRIEGDVPKAFDPDATIVQRRVAPPEISMAGTVLSWSENGAENAPGTIASVIVPSPAHVPVDDKTVPTTTLAPVIPDTMPKKRVEAIELPRAPEPQPLTQSAAPERADAPSTPQTAEALLQAFLEGAGVPRLAIKTGLTPQLMQTVGEMLRESVRGLLDLLQARAMTKREVRADATVIVAADNNPLKFSPTPEAAMAHLLVPRGTGFMPPVRAIADAHQSLRSHQIAFMAGMQAGLASVLKRIDPHALSDRAGGPSLMASFVPSTHKAQLWDQYEALHASTMRDADADFQSLFGREFLKAYQSQVTRLREQDGAPPVN